jgi:hypothetical protein
MISQDDRVGEAMTPKERRNFEIMLDAVNVGQLSSSEDEGIHPSQRRSSSQTPAAAQTVKQISANCVSIVWRFPSDTSGQLHEVEVYHDAKADGVLQIYVDGLPVFKVTDTPAVEGAHKLTLIKSASYLDCEAVIERKSYQYTYRLMLNGERFQPDVIVDRQLVQTSTLLADLL